MTVPDGNGGSTDRSAGAVRADVVPRPARGGPARPRVRHLPGDRLPLPGRDDRRARRPGAGPARGPGPRRQQRAGPPDPGRQDHLCRRRPRAGLPGPAAPPSRPAGARRPGLRKRRQPILTPVKKPPGGTEYDLATRSRDALLRSLRCLGERSFALLTQRWRTLQHITASPSRITDITKAALVLAHFEYGMII